jgi:hypothetical protein
MDWNISLDKEILISYSKIKNMQTAPCVYPIEIETRMRVLICSDFQADKLKALANEFHASPGGDWCEAECDTGISGNAFSQGNRSDFQYIHEKLSDK